jgi:hypothetical protein
LSGILPLDIITNIKCWTLSILEVSAAHADPLDALFFPLCRIS